MYIYIDNSRVIGEKMLKTYGRTTILANYTEEELLLLAQNKDLTSLDNVIIEILKSNIERS